MFGIEKKAKHGPGEGDFGFFTASDGGDTVMKKGTLSLADE